MTVTAPYPVHVDADLEPRLSRWLWLLKWLLAIPHYVVLLFLWVAFVVTSVVAFVGILFTGRYPRTIFDFNVGVLRWSWRVTYYAYGALGTDRYPPFTLHDVADYPAHLEVDYPEHLSRGLVLVKWWLLAIPHYIVLGLFLGGAGYVARTADGSPLWSAGLIAILVLVAGVALLFTGRYPQTIFDFVLGLNRWVLRVAAYVALMTDAYPPFALDQGGHETGGTGVATTPPAPAPSTRTAAPAPATNALPGPGARSGSGWTAGRVVSLVSGCVVALMALGLAGVGVTLLAADRSSRDANGYLTSRGFFVGTTGYAVLTESLGMHADYPGRSMPHAMMGDVRITATPRGGQDVFIGIARTADVERYLSGTARAVLDRVENGRAVVTEIPGGAPASAPPSADLWRRQASGSSPQTLTWSPTNGDWTVVVMNADGSPAVAADVTVGAQVPALLWVSGALLVVGALFAIVAIALMLVPTRRASQAHDRVT
jgi:hypothetical protein